MNDEIVKLATNLVTLLQKKGLFITTVESCTGGGLVNSITNILGASDVLKGAYVTYCDEEKIKLGVPEKVIKEHTVYSKETAIEMAKAGIKSIGADIGVGITGVFNRTDPDNPSSVIGKVYIGIVYNKQHSVYELTLKNEERWKLKNKAILKALKKIIKMVK